LQIYEGANEIQALVIARKMLEQAKGATRSGRSPCPAAEGIASGEKELAGA
jgi:hypothetical protein